MDASEWLGLEPTADPMRWCLPVIEGVATGGNFLFGGCGLGAAVAAMESATGRPVVWATAQYLSFAMVGDVVDLEVTVALAGGRMTQARATARVGEREILTVNAALGERELPEEGQWVDWPGLPGPDEVPQRSPRSDQDRTIMARLDMRLAKGAQWDALEGHPSPDGRSALWVRLPAGGESPAAAAGSDGAGIEMSGATLAILGDYVPFGISQTLGGWHPSTSLDNTLRVVHLVPTDWVLIDVRIEGLHHGVGHGTVYLWSQDRVLLATASQSALVRSRR